MLAAVIVFACGAFIAAMVNSIAIKNCLELGGEWEDKCIIRRNDEVKN